MNNIKVTPELTSLDVFEMNYQLLRSTGLDYEFLLEDARMDTLTIVNSITLEELPLTDTLEDIIRYARMVQDVKAIGKGLREGMLCTVELNDGTTVYITGIEDGRYIAWRDKCGDDGEMVKLTVSKNGLLDVSIKVKDRYIGKDLAEIVPNLYISIKPHPGRIKYTPKDDPSYIRWLNDDVPKTASHVASKTKSGPHLRPLVKAFGPVIVEVVTGELLIFPDIDSLQAHVVFGMRTATHTLEFMNGDDSHVRIGYVKR